MPARVTADSVKEIVQNVDLDDNLVLSHMVDQANLIVDTHLVGQGHNARTLQKIELNLAAHYVVLTTEKGGLTKTKMGDAEDTLANVYSDGFRSTRFGQVALVLDSTGILASLSNLKAKAEFKVV